MVKRNLHIALAALVFLTACSGTKENTTAKQADNPGSGDTLSYQDLYHAAAVELVGRFSRDLKAELLQAINDSGSPAGALRVCQIKSPELVTHHSTGGWSIKRVTDRPRNTAHLVSTDQSDILAKFAEPSQAPAAIELWSGSANNQTYHFYTPIRTVPLCLNCHGDSSALAPGVLAVLDSLYPDDQATGYQADQLRGMFVVEAAYPQGLESAKMLAATRDSL